MPRKPKINKVLFLQCFPLWGSGSGTYTRELALGVNKDKKIKVAIVCPESKKKFSGVQIYPLNLPFPVAFTGHPDWPVCKLYKDISPNEITEVFRFFLRSVVQAVDDFQPDILHVQHVSLLLWVANFIKTLYNINFIVTAHGTGILASSNKRAFIPLCRDALNRAKKIISVSGDTKSWLLDVFTAKDLSFKYKTRIIPGGINLKDFPKDMKIRIINKKYNLKNKKVVLFTGKLTPQKGVRYLIKAAKDIKGDVYIIGDGPERKNLEDLIYKLKLNNVHLLGYMGDDKKRHLKEFYYRADVFVTPSVWDEPLGLVILEAMSGKTPVVATRKGGIPLAVKDGINGFLFRQKMGKAARKTVEEKFVWEKIAKKYIRIYKKAYTNGNNKKKKGLGSRQGG